MKVRAIPICAGKFPPLALVIDSAAVVMNAIFLNRVDVRRGDYHIVFRKQ